MVEIPFVVLETALVVVWLLARMGLWVRRGRIDWRREFLSLLMLVNIDGLYALFKGRARGGQRHRGRTRAASLGSMRQRSATTFGKR